MLVESAQRIFSPHDIAFNQAIIVAVIGLVINLISALLLSDHHDHDHHHEHHDHNLKAAYMHVLADALTSVLAIVALFAGKYFGWHVLDPIMGIVGAIIISRWAYGLMKQTSPVLLDANLESKQRQDIRQIIEQDGPHQILDLHIWKISSDHYAAMITIQTTENENSGYFRSLLANHSVLSHLTIEVQYAE